MKRLPLRARLTLWYTLALVVAVCLFGADVLWGQGRLGVRRLDRELDGVTGTAANIIRGELREHVSLPSAAEEASEALRRGAQALAQQMQQQGYSLGPGQPGNRGPARAQQDTDPLGRPLRGRDYGDDTTVRVPGEIDVQRARRIIEELRKRFGDMGRPQEELDYIERLLKDY